ncbi:unnamed protein product [Cunninghamella blakesleeana]
MSSFKLTGWDPILNITQIISLQSCYYIVLSLLLWIAFGLTGVPITLDALFQVNIFTMDNVFGWTLGLVWLMNAIANVILILIIVQRARQVLDFVLTLHGGHILACWVYIGKFPTNLSWWFIQILSILIMTLGGEWACMKYEMKPILIQSSLRGGNKNTNTQLFENENIDDNDLPSSSAINGNDNNSRKKRKQSDTKEEGPLTTAVGIAKQVVIEKMKSKKTKDYDIISMDSVS